MPTVFVISPDWNLRALVRAELREMGVEALGMESLDAAETAVADGTLPDAIVLDASAPGIERPALTKLPERFPTLMVGSQTGPEPALSAAMVLRRPVQVHEIVAKVKELLEGHTV